MSNKIILKANYFKYPTLEERRTIRVFTPKIDRFVVNYKSAVIEFIRDYSFDTSIRNEDIYWWCNCVNNRLGKLEETFIYVQTHYLRIQEINEDASENRHSDEFLLEYFIEIFYYHFFSTRDVIGQLLNIFYCLGIEEHKVFLNKKFLDGIQSIEIKSVFTNFLNNTVDSYNIRNSFNHRYTPTQQDFRAIKNVLNVENKISINPAKKIKNETFVNDIECLMEHLSCLMNKLVLEIK